MEPKAWGLSVGKGHWHQISQASSLSAKVTKAGFFPPFIFFELNSCQVRPALTIRVSITKTRKNLANKCESKRFVKLISPQFFFFLPLCYRNILSSGTECYFHLYPISFYGCGIFYVVQVCESRRNELADITSRVPLFNGK